ncbi:hypothetical protein D3C78_1046660 [compost metagenome]
MLFNGCGLHTPSLQMRPNAKRNEKPLHLILQLHDRAIIQMVIMIMRDQHCIDFWQLVKLHRQLTAIALPAYKWKWRRSRAKHRVKQQLLPIHLQQSRRMTKPRYSRLYGRSHSRLVYRHNREWISGPALRIALYKLSENFQLLHRRLVSRRIDQIHEFFLGIILGTAELLPLLLGGRRPEGRIIAQYKIADNYNCGSNANKNEHVTEPLSPKLCTARHIRDE